MSSEFKFQWQPLMNMQIAGVDRVYTKIFGNEILKLLKTYHPKIRISILLKSPMHKHSNWKFRRLSNLFREYSTLLIIWVLMERMWACRSIYRALKTFKPDLLRGNWISLVDKLIYIRDIRNPQARFYMPKSKIRPRACSSTCSVWTF